MAIIDGSFYLLDGANVNLIRYPCPRIKSLRYLSVWDIEPWQSLTKSTSDPLSLTYYWSVELQDGWERKELEHLGGGAPTIDDGRHHNTYESQ